MNKPVKRSAIKKALMADGHSAELVEKALRKTERWMRAAYCAVDWDELHDESGDVVDAVRGYLQECIDRPDGKRTFNKGYG